MAADTVPVKTGREPTFGITSLGQEVHARTTDHLPAGVLVTRFNKWLAVRVTRGVGTMWCAYVFCCISLTSLPSVIALHSINSDVQWVAQTFLQLVLLSVIIVGQNVQNEAADARAARTFDDVEKVKADMLTALDRLDTDTKGGLCDVLEAVHALALTIGTNQPRK